MHESNECFLLLCGLYRIYIKLFLLKLFNKDIMRIPTTFVYRLFAPLMILLSRHNSQGQISGPLSSVERMDELKRAFLSNSREVSKSEESTPPSLDLNDISHLFDHSLHKHQQISGLPSLLNIMPPSSTSTPSQSIQGSTGSALHRLENKGMYISSTVKQIR